MPERLAHNSLGLPFVELQSVDSTNNYALAQIGAGMAQHGTAIFTHEQVAGKGQRGKTWLAERDSSLILSIVIDPAPFQLHEQYRLSICVAVTVCQFFNKYAGDDTKIKWPNDLYWQDRKAGGILIENLIGGTGMTAGNENRNWKHSVIGMGININQERFPAELDKAVSLRQITGKVYDPIDLAKEVCSILNDNWMEIQKGNFDDIYSKYLQNLYKIGQIVRFKRDSRIFEARVKSVKPDGKLVLEHSIEEEFWLGEIQWLIGTETKK